MSVSEGVRSTAQLNRRSSGGLNLMRSMMIGRLSPPTTARSPSWRPEPTSPSPFLPCPGRQAFRAHDNRLYFRSQSFQRVNSICIKTPIICPTPRCLGPLAQQHHPTEAWAFIGQLANAPKRFVRKVQKKARAHYARAYRNS